MGSDEAVAPAFKARRVVAGALLVSGVVHGVLAPEHLRESRLLGIGFVAVAMLQLVLGMVFLRRPAPPLWAAATILVVFSLTVYLISRTVGLPFGHEHEPEAVGALDLVSKSAELVALGGLLASMHTTTRAWRRGPSLRLAPYSRYVSLLALVGIGVILALLAIRVGSYLTPHEEEHEGSSSGRPWWSQAGPASPGQTGEKYLPLYTGMSR